MTLQRKAAVDLRLRAAVSELELQLQPGTHFHHSVMLEHFGVKTRASGSHVVQYMSGYVDIMMFSDTLQGDISHCYHCSSASHGEVYGDQLWAGWPEWACCFLAKLS